MAVISNTRGNPQASDVAVQTATPMIGGASREDAQTVISAVDGELAKLFEDRNISLAQGGLITFTGTALNFTEALELHINSRVAGGAPQVISLAATSRTLSASGRMLYAVIDRGAGTATVTADATTLPAVVAANQEVVLIAKRLDAGDGTQRCYFRQGSTYNAGQTARLGSAGGGSGSGELNEIANPSDSTNWAASGAGITVATTTTVVELPLNGLVSTGIKITPVSGTDYVRYRWTMPLALHGVKHKVEWYQNVLAGYASGDLKLEIYKNAASDYSGAYTEFPLSTDISGTSAIPAIDGKYTSTFDADTADYYELRIVRVAGTSAIVLSNVLVGPGVASTGAAVQAPTTLAPTYEGLGTVANSEATYSRYGGRMKVQGRVTVGTPTAVPGDLVLPAGFTLLGGTGGLSNQASGIKVGTAKRIVASAVAEDQVPAMFAIFYDGSTTNKLFISDRTQSSAFVKRNGSDMFSAGDILVYDFDVPVSEFAGNGVVNVAQNDVEYVSNSSTATGASDTTSFAYGSGGASFVAVVSAGATIKKRARTIRPMGASAGKPVLEVSSDGILWVPAESMFPYMEASTEKYGMRLVAGGTALTDMDVEFGGDGANGTELWSVYTSWKWRVTVQQPGVAVGFGLADATSSGLMSASAQTLGGDKTFLGTMTFGSAVATTTPHVFQSAGDMFLRFQVPTAQQAVLQFVKSGTNKWAIYSPASSNDLRIFSYGTANNNVAIATEAGVWTLGPAAGIASGNHALNGFLQIQNSNNNGQLLKLVTPAGHTSGANTVGIFEIDTTTIVSNLASSKAIRVVTQAGEAFSVAQNANMQLGASGTLAAHTLYGSMNFVSSGISLASTTKAASRPAIQATNNAGMWWGSSNGEYNGILGCFTGAGPAFVGGYFYQGSGSNELRRSGATTIPSYLYFDATSGGMRFYSAAGTGTADAVFTPAEVGNFTPGGAWTFGSTTLAVQHTVASSGADVLRVQSNGATAKIQFFANGAARGEIVGSSSDAIRFNDAAGAELGNINGSTRKWQIGNSGGTNTHSMEVNGAAIAVLSVRNHEATTASDASQAITIIKGSTTNGTTQNFIVFTINAGGTNSGRIAANGASAAAFQTFSDSRLKENIIDLPSQLDNILALRPVEFDYIGYAPGTAHQMGFIAQEMQAVYPDCVSADSAEGMLNITGWDKTSARLVKAFQELAQKLDDLQADYDAYKDSHP